VLEMAARARRLAARACGELRATGAFMEELHKREFRITERVEGG